MKITRISVISLTALVLLTACGDGTGGGSAPTTPANLQANAVSSTQVALAWDASTDDVGVTNYMIYRNGSGLGAVAADAEPPVTASAATSYVDSALAPGTEYCYRVSALDSDGHESPKSSESCATTHPPAPAEISAELYEARKNFGTPSPTNPTFPGAEIADWWFFDILVKELTGNTGVSITNFRFCRYAYYYPSEICNQGTLDSPLYIPAGGEHLWLDWEVWQYRVSVLTVDITLNGTDDFGNSVSANTRFFLTSN